MILHYCPQCGSKLQPGFKFCPSCGEKLPCPVDDPECENTEISDTAVTNASTLGVCANPSQALLLVNDQVSADPTASSMLIRSPIKSKRRSAAKRTCIVSTPPKLHTDQKPTTSPQKRKASPEVKEEEEQKKVMSPSQTVPTGKNKRTKRMCVVEPVQEGLEFCDQSGKKWKLGKLLCQTEVELTYEVQETSRRSTSNDCKHILRMGAKEGQLFNEQNFLQRAAKSAAVEKWMKKFSMDFLGIPSCVGFGLHETYRYLIFPDMGQTLQSVMDKEKEPLPERAVLQLALRLLDSLEFIHENEYAHAAIHAGNIYITTNGHSEVFLSGFGHAYRFCPGGKHVEYQEGTRALHQGNLQFISIDSHKGACPSRRSDLQSLGYCLLSWMSGTLPWSDNAQSGSCIATEKQRYMTDIPGLMSYCFKKKKVSSALQCYLSHVMAIHYTEKPDYSSLKAGLNESLQKMGGILGEPLTFR